MLACFAFAFRGCLLDAQLPLLQVFHRRPKEEEVQIWVGEKTNEMIHCFLIVSPAKASKGPELSGG